MYLFQQTVQTFEKYPMAANNYVLLEARRPFRLILELTEYMSRTCRFFLLLGLMHLGKHYVTARIFLRWRRLNLGQVAAGMSPRRRRLNLEKSPSFTGPQPQRRSRRNLPWLNESPCRGGANCTMRTIPAVSPLIHFSTLHPKAPALVQKATSLGETQGRASQVFSL